MRLKKKKTLALFSAARNECNAGEEVLPQDEEFIRMLFMFGGEYTLPNLCNKETADTPKCSSSKPWRQREELREELLLHIDRVSNSVPESRLPGQTQDMLGRLWARCIGLKKVL